MFATSACRGPRTMPCGTTRPGMVTWSCPRTGDSTSEASCLAIPPRSSGSDGGTAQPGTSRPCSATDFRTLWASTRTREHRSSPSPDRRRAGLSPARVPVAPSRLFPAGCPSHRLSFSRGSEAVPRPTAHPVTTRPTGARRRNLGHSRPSCLPLVTHRARVRLPTATGRSASVSGEAVALPRTGPVFVRSPSEYDGPKVDSRDTTTERSRRDESDDG